MTLTSPCRPRGGRGRRRPVDLVAVRAVDAVDHHPVRPSGPRATATGPPAPGSSLGAAVGGPGPRRAGRPAGRRWSGASARRRSPPGRSAWPRRWWRWCPTPGWPGSGCRSTTARSTSGGSTPTGPGSTAPASGSRSGAGLATYITTAAVYLVVVLGALTGDPVVALAVGGAFGLVRGLAVTLTRRVSTPPAAARLPPPVRRPRCPWADRAVVGRWPRSSRCWPGRRPGPAAASRPPWSVGGRVVAAPARVRHGGPRRRRGRGTGPVSRPVDDRRSLSPGRLIPADGGRRPTPARPAGPRGRPPSRRRRRRSVRGAGRGTGSGWRVAPAPVGADPGGQQDQAGDDQGDAGELHQQRPEVRRPRRSHRCSSRNRSMPHSTMPDAEDDAGRGQRCAWPPAAPSRRRRRVGAAVAQPPLDEQQDAEDGEVLHGLEDRDRQHLLVRVLAGVVHPEPGWVGWPPPSTMSWGPRSRPMPQQAMSTGAIRSAKRSVGELGTAPA